MKKTVAVLLALVMVLACVPAMAFSVSAAGDPTLNFGADAITVEAGHDFTLPLVLSNNPGIAGLTLHCVVKKGGENAEGDISIVSVENTSSMALTDDQLAKGNFMFDNTTDDNSIKLASIVFRAEDFAVGEYELSFMLLKGCSNAAGQDVTVVTAPITVTVTAAKTYSVTFDAYAGGTATGDATGLAYGASVTVSATPNEGYTFAYWLINNRLYYGKEVTFTVNSDVIAKPVFRANEATSFSVRFFTKDGRLVATMDSTALRTEEDLPPVPVRFGYEAEGWDIALEDAITADVNVYPNYTKDTTNKFKVTVKGGTATETKNILFETRVTVTANNPDTFKYWKTADGIASTSSTYSFLVTGTVTLTAETEKAVPDYFMTLQKDVYTMDMDDDKYSLSVIGDTFAANGYTVVERGILYSNTADSEDTLQMYQPDVKRKASSTAGNGKFMFTLNNIPQDVEFLNVRAYMIVQDANGVSTTVYSDTICDGAY